MSAQAARRTRDAASVPDPVPVSALGEPDATGIGIFGVVLCCASAALAAVIEVLLTPFYLGSVLVPISIVLAVASNVALPIISRSLVDSVLAAAAPVVVWVAVVLALSLPRPEGDVLLPGGKGGQLAVSYSVLLLGVLAGVITVSVAGRIRSSQPSPPSL